MAFGRQSKAAAKREREPLDEAALYAYAVRSLGRKMRTIAELKKLMSRRCLGLPAKCHWNSP